MLAGALVDAPLQLGFKALLTDEFALAFHKMLNQKFFFLIVEIVELNPLLVAVRVGRVDRAIDDLRHGAYVQVGW